MVVVAMSIIEIVALVTLVMTDRKMIINSWIYGFYEFFILISCMEGENWDS